MGENMWEKSGNQESKFTGSQESEFTGRLKGNIQLGKSHQPAKTYIA